MAHPIDASSPSHIMSAMSSPSSSAPPPPTPPQLSSISLSHSRPPPSVTSQHRRAGSDTPMTRRPVSSSNARSVTPAFPFSFILPFQPNPSSTGVVPSTAEGRPIPVDDSTVENRTSALRELNSNYPSRHRYERSTGAQSTTYSEPVIVRSYYSPLPPRPISTSHGGVIVHGGAGTVSQSGSSATAERRSLPFSTTVTTARNGMLGRMGRSRGKARFDPGGPDETKLPPVEAFTFKSFMANMDAGEGSDINADLDRIAEICARSRYSLSNQYEVHYAPHGSGSSFVDGVRAQETQGGPTLQAVSSDDERRMRRQRRRPMGPRRNSRAMGTLETIMSSSRSSDEDKSKKKPAAELAEEVRGRASRKTSGDASPTGSSPSIADDQSFIIDNAAVPTSPPRRTASLALIDSSKQNYPAGDPSSPRNSATTLVGEPAQPQASTSHLEIRTTPEDRTKETNPPPPMAPASTTANREAPLIRGTVSSERGVPVEGLLSTLSGWIPWRSVDVVGRPSGRAEGSLRELLRSSEPSRSGDEALS